MRKEIITRIIVWIVAIILILLGGYAVKEYVIDRPEPPQAPSVNYSINTNAFGGVVVYNETLDLSKLTITKTENGVTTEIPVDASMITTPVDTTRVGTTVLKLSYEGQEFSVPVAVKYRVQFATGDNVFETIYTLSATDIEKIEAPQKEGYTFTGWSTEIPDILFDNMNLVATYEAIIPSLPTVEATYGDALASIKLPENAAGAWKLDYAEGTVGNAGRRTFDASFIENGTNAVLKTAKLIVNVARRAVKIDVFADLTYNGKRQEPTYKTDIDVKVSAWWDGNKNYTDAGEYSYHFEVDDSNYIGEAKGTFIIKPAVITVEIKDAQILSDDALPKIEYQISEFEGMSQEALAEFIGLTIVYPQKVVVGEHKITAKASNPSIQLEVKEGTLKVVQATLEGIGEPVLLSKVATYEDLIGSIGFEMHPNGKWIWETPDAKVGTVGKQKHVAIFVPSNSAYEQIKCEVEITVVPKQMVIEVVGSTTFDYDGADHNLSVIVKDAAGTLYDTLEVLGNDLCKKAGTYTITLTLADPNYSATKVVTLTINKIDPVTDFTQVFKAVWSATLKLSDIKLPEGYAWVNPDKRIETAGSASYAVIFTPADTDNYNSVTGEFKLEVAKASAEIKNVEESYSFTYNGNAITLDRVTRPHEESKLVFAYFKDGKPVESMIEAGVYTVKITLPESENYKLAEATTTVTINPAANTDNVNTSQTATYGDLAQNVIKLPESAIGTWSIKGADENTTVGNFGENKFVLLFTPATQNYSTREVEITVTVAKKQINPPTISTDKREQVYTGQTLTSGLQNGEGYVITDNGGINVDTYTVTVALASTNYIWSDGTTEDKTLTYEITKASVVISDLAIEGWTYGQTAKTPSANATFGVSASLIYKYYTDAECTNEIGVPGNAGTYYLKAYFAGNDNLKEAWSDRATFVIKKQVVELPDYAKEYTYTGSTIKANIPSSTLYTVSDSGHITAGNYSVSITLVDFDNYEWAGEAASNKTQTLSYSIVAADLELDNLNVPDITYGETLVPVVDKKFNVNITFKYSTTQNGEYTTTVPTNAGTYYVIAEFAGNQNINADKIGPVSFEIKKAQATIQGVRDDKTYTAIYNGNAYTITGVTASNGVELLFTSNGATFTGATNAGTYLVTITLPEDDNFKGDSVDVTIVIKAAANKDTVTDLYNATYGDLVMNVITLPSDNEGTWTLKDVNATTTVGNAGTGTFTAVFTPDATGNYESREVTITIKVAPKKIAAPTIADDKKEQTYTGSKLTSGLQSGEGYTVTDEGGTFVGSYTVTVSLESTNYIWTDGTSTSKVYTYKIVASENTQEIVTTYNATYGDLLKDIVVLPVGVEGTWSIDIENFDTAIVGNAGKNTFTAIFEPDEHGDYIRREVTITIHVAKATVPAPSIDQNKLSQVYTGNKLTSGLTVADDALYTIVDAGGEDVDTYYATLSLKDSANYKWDTTGKSDDIKLEYAITKAQITFTSAVNLGGWTFGNTAGTPGVTTNFPCTPTFVYASELNGPYTEAQPTNAGTYYVKAIAADDDNLIGAESEPVKFVIAKASVTINGGEDSYSKVYNGSAFTLPSVSTSNGADFSSVVIVLNGTTVVDTILGAGDYTITYKVDESGNNLAAERKITVTIEKANVTISAPVIDNWTYGDAAKMPNATANPNVALTYKYFSDAACSNEIAAPTNAGTYYVKAYFAGNDNYNAAETETATSFTIAKKVIATPTVPNASIVYNGKTQNSGLANTSTYTVADGGHKNKGTYDVTLTLKDSANYAWNTVDNANKTVTVQYTITEGTNAISNVSYTASWTYGQTVSAFSAKATYGDIAIKYLVGGEWIDVRPTNAGTYQVKFFTTDTNCPIISTDPYTFTIEKAAPAFSGAENTYEKTYDGDAFEIPTVTASSGATVTYVINIGGSAVSEIVGAGLYNITYSVAENENYKAGTMTVSVQIKPAEISFVGAPTIENWTFNSVAKLPIVDIMQDFVDEGAEVYYEYRRCLDEENNVWTDWTRWGVALFDLRSTRGIPTEAGKYELRAKVEENANYANAATLESETITFVIAKADPTINGVADGNIYTPTYTGDVYTIPGLSASYPGAPALEYAYTKKNVETGLFEAVSEIRGAGEYSVTITLPESANYNKAEVVVTVTVQKADVTITKPAINGWIYNTTANAPSAALNESYAQSTSVAITFKYFTDAECTNEITTPVNAGTYYVKAFFAGDDNLNTAESEATKFVIAKATIQVPTVDDKEYADGATITSGLTVTETDKYKITEDDGGSELATYTVTLEIKDAYKNNYEWITSSANATINGDTVVISYRIVKGLNSWQEGKAPAIDDWTYGETGNTGTATPTAGTLVIEYKVRGAEDSTYTTTLPTEAGNYTARFTVTDANHTDLVVWVDFTIKQKEVTVPTIADDKKSQTYTGGTLTSGLTVADEGLYTIDDDGGINVGGYKATLTLKDKANYKWSSGDTDEDGIIELSYSIGQAKITVTTPTISGWTYNQSANAPQSTPSFTDGVTVIYEYFKEDNGNKVSIGNTAPTDAGKYYVVATATTTNANLIASDASGYVEFNIAKADASIIGVNDEKTYSKTYDGNDFTLPVAIKGNYDNAPAVTYTKYKNAGTYTVVLELPASKNYNGATETVTIIIKKVENSDNIPTYAPTYGTLLKDLALPTHSQGHGTWSWKDATNETTVGNAGQQTHTLFFDSNDENYADRTVTVTMNVAKKTIAVPEIPTANKSQTYTGEKLYSGLTNGEGYTVSDIGGTNVGDYYASITLDTTNYQWADASAANTLQLMYSITPANNDWITEPTIKTEWTYGDIDNLDEEALKAYKGFASAIDGTVNIQYALYGSDDFTDTFPTNAGKYVAKFTVDSTNYTDLEKEIEFTILKKKIAVPEILTANKSQTYTGEKLYSGLTNGEGYTVSDIGGTNVGDYYVTITLNTTNYQWDDVSVANTFELKYSITKASVTLSNLSITSWIYGKYNAETNKPTVTIDKAFSDTVAVIFEYSADGGTTWSTTVPTNAGSYKVRARVAETSNHNAASITCERDLVIAKAEVTTPTLTTNEFPYTGTTIKSGFEAAADALYTSTDNGGTNVGDYSVKLTLKDKTNYMWSTTDKSDDIELAYKIVKADVTVSAPTIQGWTFGEDAKAPSASADFGMTASLSYKYATAIDGVYTDTVPSNAGTYYVKAYFAGNTNLNEAWSNATEFTIAKASVTVPSVSNKPYNTETQTSGLTAGTGYVVKAGTDNGGKNVGTYTVTVSLASNNYIWADGTTADKELTYKITPIDNKQDITTSYSTIFGTSISIIQLPAGIEGTWSIEGDPTTVGNAGTNTFVAIFTPDSNGNYNSRRVTITVNVEKATVNVPGIDDDKKSQPYTGSTLTSGLQSTADYTVSDNGGINAGDYKATLTLTNSANYKWSSGDDNDDGIIELSYSITKGKITFYGLAVDNTTFGQTLAPSVTVRLNGVEANNIAVTFKYYSDANCTNEVTPVNVGTYYVKAIVAANGNNYDEASTSKSFAITKADATIGNVGNKTPEYRPGGYSIADLFNPEPSHSETTLVYSMGDQPQNTTDKLFDNLGTYTVVITLPESANYNKAEVTVTVTITAIDNKQEIASSFTATFGDNLWTAVGLGALNDAAVGGSWSIKDADGNALNADTLVGDANATGYTFKLVFTPNSSNYNSREETITVVVNKAAGSITVGEYNATQTYNGQAFTIPTATAVGGGTVTHTITKAGVTVTEIKNVGTYTITYSAAESANYGTATKTITVTITKGTNTITEASISGWTYGQAGNTGSATVTYGGFKVEYKLASAADSAYSTTLPTAAGNYVARFTTTDSNCDPVSVTRTFTITKATVTPPTITNQNEVKYTGSKIPSGFTAAADALYTATEDNAVNVGTYYVKLTLKDKDNYMWSTTDKSDDLSIQFVKITKGTVVLEGLSAGWTYGNFVTPTVTVKLNGTAVTNISATFTYSATENGTYTSAVPTNAGTYYVKADIAGTTNYDAAPSVSAQFIIQKATPTITTAPSFVGGSFYQNRFAPGTTNAANGAVTSVPGTWSFGTPVFTAGTATSCEVEVTYTFTPTDTTNYNTIKSTDTGATKYTITLVAVAKMDSTYYGTIKAAVEVANVANGGTIVVLAYNTDLGPIYITEDILIEDAGTTLVLPYGVNGEGRNTYDNDVANFDLHGGPCSNNKHGYGHALADETMCHVKVIVAEGVTITNYGVIEVSGQLSGGGAGAPYAGHTAGEHARLILGKNAKIENYKIIRAAGFIYEETKNNGSTVTVYSGATLYQPYVLKDYISGQYLVGPKKLMEDGVPLTPFNMFLFMNISSTVRINNGGSMVVWAALYTGSTDGINTTKQNFIGSGGVILFDGETSYLTAKYDRDTEVNKLDLYGGATTDSMKLDVNVVVTITVDTKDCLFPLTYLYDVTLHNGDYKMGQRFKMMPGAKLTVAEDATVNIDTLIVYDETFVDGRTQINSIYLYPQNKGAAEFTVNGSATIGTLGGKVTTQRVGASVNITNALSYTAYEPKTYIDGKYMWVLPSMDITTRYTITKNAMFDGIVEVTANSTGTWVAKQVTLNYNDDGATPTATGIIFVHSTNKTYASLPELERNGYAFQGWFNGDTKVNVGDAFPYDATTPPTLTAHWTIGATITLDYNDKGATPEENLNLTFGANDVKTYSNLPEPADRAGYTKDGWYYGNTKVTNGAEFAYNGNHTLTFKWNPIAYNVNVVWKEGPGFTFDDTILAQIGTPPTMQYNAEMEVIEWPVVSDKYTFGGWYSDAACTKESLLTIISGANLFALAQSLNGDVNNGNITIYGQWVPMQYTIYYDGDRYSEYIMDSENYTEYYLTNNTVPFYNFDPADSPDYLKRDHYFVGWEYNGELLPADVTNVNQFIAKYANNEEGTISFVLTARWAPKAKVTFSYGTKDPNGFTTPDPIWVLPGTEVTFTEYLNQTVTAKDADPLKQYYFGGWQVSGNGTLNGTKVTANGDVTVEPIWASKVSFKINANTNAYPTLFDGIASGFRYGTSYWFKSGSSITLPDVTVNDGVTKDNTKVYYFGSWTKNNTTINETGASNSFTLSEETTITITWMQKVEVKITCNQHSGQDVANTFTVAGISVSKNEVFYLKQNTTYNMSAKADSGALSAKITGIKADVGTIGGTTTANSGNTANFTYTTTTANATITITGEDSCLVEGTLITLADGTQKKIEDITADDLLLVFNHETGKYEARKITYVDHANNAPQNYRVLNLVFSNGEMLRIVGSHGVYDTTLNKYVYINYDNAYDFIGHTFYASEFNGTEFVGNEIELVDVYVTEEFVRVYSPITVYEGNCFANNMLTITPLMNGVESLVDIFDFDENMMFDMEKKEAEIEEYGLYTYEDFADLYTEEQFNTLLTFVERESQFFKLSMAKGRAPKEDIVALFNFILAS